MALPVDLPGRASPCRRLSLLVTLLTLAAPALASAGAIRGTVLDPDGQRVPSATVRVERSPTHARSVVTDAKGEFHVEGLAPGDYVVRVLATGLRADPQTLSVGDDDTPVTIRMALSALTESIVVSAAQVETARSTGPGTIAVIGEEDLRVGQTETAADALRQVTGTNVTRSGGRGALTSLLPRGGESDYTLVFVDGIRQNSFGGGYDFATLLVPDVDRIEVVQGPQSALFGPDAIGGVVQVVSRSGSAPSGDALAEWGSFNTARLNGAATGSWSGLAWGAAAEHQRSDGFTGTAPATGETVTNDDSHATVVSARGAYAWQSVDVRGSARHARTERGYPGPFGSDPNGTYPGIDRVSRGSTAVSDGGAVVTANVTDQFRVRGDATLAQLDSDFVSPFGRSVADTRRATGRLLVDAQLSPSVSVSAGGEVLDERATSTYITDAAERLLPVTRRSAGAFAEARFTAARLQVTGGVRLDRLRRDALAASGSPYLPRPTLPADSVVAVSPRLAVGWFASPPSASSTAWTRLNASAGTGIRPPDAFEIAFTDNPSLKPERSRSVEAGVEQGLRGGAVVIEATAFHNEYDDLIVAVGRSFIDASRFQTDNIANARSSGLEVALWSRWPGGLSFRASYAWLDTEVLAVDGVPGVAPAPFDPGDPLIRRPRHRASVLASVTRARWNAFARLGARGRVLDVDPTLGAFGGTIDGPGYAVLDAGGAIRTVGGVEVFGRVGNVLNANYEEVVGYPALGRHVMAGVRIAAGR